VIIPAYPPRVVNSAIEAAFAIIKKINSKTKKAKVETRRVPIRRRYAQIRSPIASRVHTKMNAAISIPLGAAASPSTGKSKIATNVSQKNEKPPKVINPKRLFFFHSISPVISRAIPPANTPIPIIGLVRPIRPALQRLSRIVVIPKAHKPRGVGLGVSFTIIISFLVEFSICTIKSLTSITFKGSTALQNTTKEKKRK